MSKKPDLDSKRVLELLQDPSGTPKSVAARLGCSPEAVDEARSLVEEIATAEADAILAMPAPLARALLRAAALAGRQELLLEADAHGNKELQREARRVAHVLKLRGVDVGLPVREPEAPHPVQPAPAAEPPVFLSSLDPAGDRVVFWTRALPGRGVELAQLLIGERGVDELALGEMSRKRFRELAEELPRSGTVTIVEMPRDEVRRVLDRARVAGREGGKLPGNFPAWAAQVLGQAPLDAPPPLRPTGEGHPADDELTELARRSGELFREPELSRWLPDDDEAVRHCALAVEEASRSMLYLAGEAGEGQRAAAVSSAIDRAVEGYFDERRRLSFSARLLDTGAILERTGRPEAARIAASAARLLAAGAPLAHIPFARELFARLFTRGPKPEAPSASALLVDPAGEEGGKVSPSGIILPE